MTHQAKHYGIVGGLFLLLAIIMLAPGSLNMFKPNLLLTDSPHSRDVMVKLWDYWYWSEGIFREGSSVLYTDLIFYPLGASLALHNPNFFQIGLMLPFAPILGLLPAYNLAIFITIVCNALAVYSLLDYLVERREAAFIGASLFAFSPWVMEKLIHSELLTLWPIPLIVLFTLRAIREKRLLFAVMAGLILGFTGFVTLYITIVSGLTLGFIILGSLPDHRHQPRYWLTLATVIGPGLLLTGLRIAPMVSRYSTITAKAADNTAALSAFFTGNNPLLWPEAAQDVHYIGVVVLVIIGIGLAKTAADQRRIMGAWLAVTLFFMALSMGDTVTIMGTPYPYIPNPKAIIDSMVPQLLAGFARPRDLQLGVLLPLAVTTAYSLQALLPDRHTRLAAAGILIIALFDIWSGPIHAVNPIVGTTQKNSISSDDQAFFETVGENDGAVIMLPFVRGMGKTQLLMQTMHEQPILWGMLARDPDHAMDYIKGNDLLMAWHERKQMDCTALDPTPLAQDLIDDDFATVVVGLGQNRQSMATYFPDGPYAQTDFWTAYDLRALIESPPCN